jgi:GT2 family glycosyltransferase
MLRTAVVILNWNGLGYMQKFLANVVIHSTGENTQVIVADNGSTDGSADWVEENHKEVRVIRLDRNYGFAGGYNNALRQVNATYIVLLNSDIEVTPHWLDPMIAFLDNNQDVASVQPKILSYNNKKHFEHAGAAGCFIDKYGYPFCRGRIISHTENDFGQYDTDIDIFWSSGACMAMRSDAWDLCGGFDDDFFAHMEEIDLCWRFHKAGYRVSYIAESVIYHVGGGTLPYSSPMKVYLNFRNSLFLLFKNLPEKELHRILFIRKILDGLAAVYFVSKGSFSSAAAVWRAHMDYYRSKKKLKSKRSETNKLHKTEPYTSFLNKSIVLEFYIKGHKTYSSLVK